MKKILYTITSATLLSLPILALADASGTGPSTPGITVQINNPFKGGNDLASIVTAILQYIVMPIAAVVVVLAIIYSGFKYLTAQGKPEAIKDANRGLMYVLIGAAILLGATGISAAIQGTICGSLITCS